jgi:mannose-6-phosphate isomerase-like protein (cupin superfamily)
LNSKAILRRLNATCDGSMAFVWSWQLVRGSYIDNVGQMSANTEAIVIDGSLYAIIIRAHYDVPGIQFFTDSKYSQQLASMSYQSGKVIPAHTHNPARREVLYTQETLFIRKGKVRVDFYSEALAYQTSRVLGAGDVILLISGGHGFEVLEDSNMIEVKQGPYAGEADKTRFASVSTEKVKIEG